jgi:hypothetical protein
MMKVDPQVAAVPQTSSRAANSVKVPVQKEQAELTQTSLTSDVYHQTANLEQDPVYNRPVVLGTIQKNETFQEMADRTAKATGLLQAVVLPKTAEKMFSAYEQVEKEITQIAPELADKAWGFSVAEDGRLTVSGDLTDEQKQLLETKLNENAELVNLAQSFKDTYLQGTSLLRDANGHSQGWGKYDVNQQNFAEIIDFKALFDASKHENGVPAVGGGKINQFTFSDTIYQQIKRGA